MAESNEPVSAEAAAEPTAAATEPVAASPTAAVKASESGHLLEPGHVELDEPGHGDNTFSDLDRSFGRVVATGYVGGFVAVFIAVVILLSWASSLPFGAILGASAGVATVSGILGAVLAVGQWSAHHDEELFR
jgi:hypothetical protein